MKKFTNKNLVWKNISIFVVAVAIFRPSCMHAQMSETPNVHKIFTIKYEFDRENESVSQEAIESRVQLKNGNEFSSVLADASIKALYATGLFDNVSVRADEIGNSGEYEVTFSLSLRSKIGEISFDGNQNFKHKVLIKKITSKSGGRVSQDVLQTDVASLVKFYNDKGFPYAKSSFSIKNSPSGATDVVFSIDEGEKFYVGKITFPGNNVVKESELLAAMQTKKWTLLSFLKKSGLYREENFNADIDALRTVFRNHGYLDVEIHKKNIEYIRRRKSVDIRIPVDVKQQYFVGKLEIKGNEVFDYQKLQDLLSLHTGDAFSPAKIEASCEKIRDFYGKSGYINTQISSERKLNLASNEIDVVFLISESEKCFVGEIEIHGNSKTKNKVILRELSIVPGDIFDIVRMKNSRSKLANTGYFSQVDITPVDTSVPHVKDIRVDVKEANTGRAGFGGGVSTGGEVVGFLEFRQQNFDLASENRRFQGGGQRFRSRAQVGKHSTMIDVNFEEPWWYDREISVGADLFFHKSDYDKSLKDYSGANYNEGRLGAEFYLRKRIYGLWEGRLAYHIEDVNIYNIAKNAPPTFFREKGHSSVSKLMLSIEHDTRNDYLYPTAGSKFAIDAELAGGPFLGSTKYFKTSLLASKYWMICEPAQQVLSVAGRIGTMFPFGGDETPFFDRFYLGGPNFMKGFKSHEVGPRENGTGIGGNSFAYVTAEYCFKIAEPLRLYLFAEAGFVNERKWNFSTRRHCTDAGFGFKISIMGMPLRLDFGFPIHGDSGNKHGMRFNYSFGVSF